MSAFRLLPLQRTCRRWLALAVALLCLPTLAWAAPTTLHVEGVLLGAGGAPAVDGSYKLTIALHASASGAGAPLFSEGPLDVTVAGGRFALVVGGTKALDPALLAAGDRWIGVQVGGDPELPRQLLRAVPYAMVASSLACSGCVAGNALADGGIAASKVGFNYAGAATKGGAALDLSCSGCVSVGELAFDGDVDLGGNSLKAKNATLSGDVVAKTVTAVSFLGDGSKLTGVSMPAGSCASGEAVVGIASDGKLVCKSLAGSLPADGLDEVSGGMLTTEFKESAALTSAIAIPDNSGASASATLKLPDWGKAKSITVAVKLANTDLASVSAVLLPPDDKKVGYVLCDPCGSKDAKSLDTAWTATVKPKAGDLATWLGKSLAGDWTLLVTDTAFCVPQAPGNSTLCDLQAKTDGTLTGFSITADVVSAAKVGVGGDLLVKGGVQLGNSDAPCTAAIAGMLRWTGKDLQVCTGKAWRRVDNAPPTLLSLAPAAGPLAGGTVVTLKGKDFTDSMDVTFGGVAATSVTFVSTDTVTAVVPKGAAVGPVDVEVSLGAGESSKLAKAWFYELDGLVAAFDTANPASWGGSGTVWKDVSGKNTHATMVGGLVAGTRGGVPAMIFNGSGAGAQFANGNLGKKAFTAVMWVYAELPGSDQNMGGLYVNRDGTTANSADWVWFGRWSTDNWYFRVNNGACCNDLPGSGTGGFTAKVPNSQWKMVHFAFQTGVGNGWKWGVDGTNVAAATLSDRPNSQTSAVSTIGWGHEGSGAYWKGGIGSARFYDRLLSDAELAVLYAGTKAGYGL